MATEVTDFSFGFVDTPGFREFEEIPDYSYRRVVYFASPFRATQAFFKGSVVRTATGSGVGSSSTSAVRIVLRTATDSGSGASSIAYIEVLPRSASGTGTGTSGGGATWLYIAPRTATGFGLGSSTAISVFGSVRTASGSGLGTSSVTYRKELFRTATGTNTATETASGRKVYRVTATGSGTSSETPASFVKLLIFRPPTDSLVRWADFAGRGIANRFFSHVVPGERGRNVYKLIDGSFTENEQRDIAIIVKTYYGGHENIVTQSEKDELIAAGYGAYIT